MKLSHIVLCFAVAASTAKVGCKDDPRPAAVSGSGVPDIIGAPYQLDVGLQSRSITAENPKGKKGLGGRAASRLGEGRKGSPNIVIGPGETATLVDIDGPGTVRHVWMTTFGPRTTRAGRVDWLQSFRPHTARWGEPTKS